MGGGGHEFGGLFLAIGFAAVGDGGAVAEIAGDGGGVVEIPEETFPWVRLEGFALEEVEELFGFTEASAWVGGGPEWGVVGGDVPAGGAA